MPPLVPETAKAKTPEDVTGEPDTPISPPEKDAPTEVTDPPLVEGTAQVPSPRQNVVDDAEVPEFRLPTGKLPTTPVESGRPVALVKTAADGVPRAGVMSVGDVARAIPPEPVTDTPRAAGTPAPSDVTPVPPFDAGSVPVTPVVSGRPVALVNVPDMGVPKAAPVRIGDVSVRLETVVIVFPRGKFVDPKVIGVAKFASRLESGRVPVAAAKI